MNTPERAEERPTRDELTRFLLGLGQGDADSVSTLMPIVYGELKAIAQGYLKGEQAAGKTLQPTALVHEVFLKLFDHTRLQVRDRRHFYALAAKSMRQVLVDHARERRRSKRGGGWQRHPLEDLVQLECAEEVDLIDLEEALGELVRLDPRQAEVVELRFFGGLTMPEAAEVLGVSLATAEREWASARAWLAFRLSGRDA